MATGAQQVKPLPHKPETQSSIPRTHVKTEEEKQLLRAGCHLTHHKKQAKISNNFVCVHGDICKCVHTHVRPEAHAG